MTNQEAIKQYYLLKDFHSNEKMREALDRAIENATQWHELNVEKPKISGWYLTYAPNRRPAKIDVDLWIDSPDGTFKFSWSGVTHWYKPIEPEGE